MCPPARCQRLLRLCGALGALVLVFSVAGCDENDTEQADNCELVGKGLLREVLGGDTRTSGGVRPRHMNSHCLVLKRGDSHTYLNISARYLPATELAETRRQWPRTAAEIKSPWCHDDPWVAPGDGMYGTACVERVERKGLPNFEVTHMSSLSQNLYVKVTLARPRAQPSDIENANRIAADVAKHMSRLPLPSR